MKTVLITGGSQGIGLGIVRKFLTANYQVITCGRKNTLELDHLQIPNELQKNLIYIKCDISDESDRKSLINQIVKQFEKIDVLINNAGVAPRERKDILEIKEQDFDWLLKINLNGPFFLSQIVANEMIRYKDQKHQEQQKSTIYQPCIINISSISAWTVSINRAEYCVAKAGLAMTTQLYAVRLAEYGIPVFEIQPGIIDTPMTEKVHERYDKMIQDGIFPLKRWGKTEDIATCVFAIAEGSIPYSTGQVIQLDGGFHIHRL